MRFIRLLHVSAAFILIACASLPARAQTTWVGTSGTALWDIGSNWSSGTAPVSGGTTSLVFAGSTLLSSTNNIANLTLSGLTLSNTSVATNVFTLSGSTVTLGGNLTLSAAATGVTMNTDEIKFGMILNAERIVTLNPRRTLQISGSIGQDVSGRRFVKSGNGTLILTSTANSFGIFSAQGPVSVTQIGNAGDPSQLGIGGIIESNGLALTYSGNGETSNKRFQVGTNNNNGNNNGLILANNGLSGPLTFTGSGGFFTTPYTSSTAVTRDLTLKGSNSGDNAITATIVDVNSGTTALTLTKQDAGKWILSGSNTYTGATTVSAGTLQIGSGGITGLLSASSSITVASGATLAFSRSDTMTQGIHFNSAIGGAGNVTQVGPGTLVLNGANTYTGTTTITAGTLRFATQTALYNNGTANWIASKINVKSGATLALNVGGSGEFTQGDVSTLLTNLASSTSAATGMNAGALLGFDTTSASTSFEITTAIANTTGSFGGARGLVKLGSGTLTLSGNNSYSGGATISLGELTVGHANALGTGTTTVNGGVLAIGTYAPSVAGFTISSGSLTGSGTLTATSGYSLQGGALGAILGSGAITVSTGTTTLGTAGRFNSASGLTISSGQLTLGGNETVASFVLTGGILAGSGNTLTSGSAYDVQSGSVLANLGGSIGLVKSTGGTVTLSGSNTYAGQTRVSAGVLALGAGNAISNQSNLLVDGGGFNLAGFSDTVGTVTLTSGSIFGSGTLAGSSYALQGGALNTVLGSGTITVSTGTTTLGSGGRFNSASALTVQSGQLTLSGNETVAGFTLVGGRLAGSGQTLTSNGAISLQAGEVLANLAGSNGITKLTSGSVTLGGLNTYTGTTAINAGSLVLGADNAIPNDSIVALGTGSTAGMLVMNGKADTIRGLAFNGTGSQVANTNGGKLTLQGSGTNPATITVNTGSHALHPDTTLGSDTTVDVAADSIFSLHGVVDGSKSLTKIGSGTMTIFGGNSFSGGVFINSGLVSALNSTALGTGTVTISGNSILNLNNYVITNAIVFASGSGAVINSGTFVGISGTGTIDSGTGATITTDYNVLASSSFSFVSSLGAQVDVQGTAAASFSGPITTAGEVNVLAGGRGTFTGAMNGTVTTAGLATFNAAVNSTVTVTGGTATFSSTTGTDSAVNTNAGTSVFNGSIGGVAHATQAGATSEIRGDVLATADVRAESGGTVKLLGSGAFGAAGLFNGGSVMVDRDANLVLAAVITGTGSLTKLNGTTLTLTGNNTYSGLTTISGGTLSVGNGGTSGALAGNVVNNAALIFNRSDDLIYAGNISGSGGLTKLGAGKLIFTGSSSYGGITTVSNGTLAINGQIASSAAVASGATLGGSGVIGGVLSGAGLVSPGNSPGILTASQFDPTGGLDAAFELTGLSPVYNAPSASVNDILRLTSGTPFTGSFGGSNVIDFYFNMGSVDAGTYEAGFFTTVSADDLFTALQNASVNYWIKDAGGSQVFNGVNYSPYSGVTLSTATVTRDFGAGNVTGSVTQFIIVPEPESIVLACGGIAVAAWAARRRRS